MTGRSERFERIGNEVGKLVAEKNAAYGDSFARSGEIMAIFYPSGISREQMTDALGVVRVVDKLFRIATDRDALGESPWRDIAGYGVLGAARAEAPSTREEVMDLIFGPNQDDRFRVVPEDRRS